MIQGSMVQAIKYSRVLHGYHIVMPKTPGMPYSHLMSHRCYHTADRIAHSFNSSYRPLVPESKPLFNMKLLDRRAANKSHNRILAQETKTKFSERGIQFALDTSKK